MAGLEHHCNDQRRQDGDCSCDTGALPGCHLELQKSRHDELSCKQSVACHSAVSAPKTFCHGLRPYIVVISVWGPLQDSLINDNVPSCMKSRIKGKPTVPQLLADKTFIDGSLPHSRFTGVHVNAMQHVQVHLETEDG